MSKKTIIFTALFIVASSGLFAWELVNYDRTYYSGYDEMGGRNYLPDVAGMLEEGYGIKSVIYRDERTAVYSPDAQAAVYMMNLKLKPDDRVILLYFSAKYKQGILKLSPALGGVFPAQAVRFLQDEFMENMTGRWYISDIRVATKVLGTLVYALEKGSNVPEAMVRERGNYIKYDDRLFGLSGAPVLRDLLKLFFLEPVSFIIYFPVVMFFVIVVLIGSRTRAPVYVFNVLWLASMAFFLTLVYNKLYVIFPEYMLMFSMMLGLTSPLYFYLMAIYSDEIGAAAYGYYFRMRDNFGMNNAFNGKGGFGT